MEEKSLLEIAIEKMTAMKAPQNIYKFLDEVLASRGISSDDEAYIDIKAQLYTDMVTSARFVYCGEDEWDLKDNQPLDVWDKDASDYNTGVEEEAIDEDEEENNSRATDVSDFDLPADDDSDEEDHEDSDDVSYEDDDNDYDEDEYNDVMDDYEDLYEDK